MMWMANHLKNMFNPYKGQWWNEPAGKQQFIAYYMTLRVHYQMSAREAFLYAKDHIEIIRY